MVKWNSRSVADQRGWLAAVGVMTLAAVNGLNAEVRGEQTGASAPEVHASSLHLNSPDGYWSGNWRSCTTRHKGKLQATFCRLDEHRVRASFSGTFFKILRFKYSTVLRVVHEEPGLMKLSGSQQLGRRGTFSYQATITGNRFTATYRSKKDYGVWSMTRR